MLLSFAILKKHILQKARGRQGCDLQGYKSHLSNHCSQSKSPELTTPRKHQVDAVQLEMSQAARTKYIQTENIAKKLNLTVLGLHLCDLWPLNSKKTLVVFFAVWGLRVNKCKLRKKNCVIRIRDVTPPGVNYLQHDNITNFTVKECGKI